jgi:hypothetical protein
MTGVIEARGIPDEFRVPAKLQEWSGCVPGRKRINRRLELKS